jgi:glycosyltransferase involved in cell wall biosynthesis
MRPENVDHEQQQTSGPALTVAQRVSGGAMISVHERHATSPRILFIPVSAQQGIGEYARSHEIAIAVSQRLPHADIHFVLNKMAPYAASVPFRTTWLPSSATFHPHKVAALIREYCPTLVIFDNAGRTVQLKAASEVNARVVFISSRSRQRRKAFRLRWMQLIDEHWIAYPEFVAGSLSPIERLKLKLMDRPVVRYMDTVMPEIGPLESERIVTRFGLQRESYVLVVPGGGTGHPGAENGPQVMAEAAARLAMQGHQIMLVGGDAPSSLQPATLRHSPRLPMSDLAALMGHARVVITNGGDTLLQAMACARACVATAIAGDQVSRIARCAEAGLVVGSSLDARELERAALSLLRDESRRTNQQALLSRLGITNGIGAAVDAISTLAVV